MLIFLEFIKALEPFYDVLKWTIPARVDMFVLQGLFGFLRWKN